MFLEKFLPARYVKVIETLRADADLSRDAVAMATILQNAAEKIAKKDSPECKEMKPVLENLGYVLSLAATYIKEGTVPKKSMFYVGSHFLGIKKKLEALEPLLDKDHSVTKFLMDEIVTAPGFLDTCHSLTNRMEGSVFKTLRADKGLTKDAMTIMTTLQSAVEKIANKEDPQCREMKPALENMASLLSLSTAYIKDGVIPEKSILEAITHLLGVRDSVKALEPLGQKDHPIANLLRDEIMGTPGFLDACRNLMDKTQGSIFKIEPDADGSAGVRELVTGRDLPLFRLTSAQYAEMNSVLSRHPPKAGPSSCCKP